MAMSASSPSVWVLADDRAGNVTQAVGVAEALGWPFLRKDIRYGRLGVLANVARGASLLGVTEDCRNALVPPWPDLVIGAGRRTAPVARWIRRQNPATRLCQIMDPGWPGRDDFAVIAVPSHDDHVPAAANVLPVIGAPHRVTPELLAREAERWRSRLEFLPRPWLAVIVGGTTRHHRFTADHARRLAESIGQMAEALGASLLITTSRRTGPEAEAVLAESLTRPAHWFRWGDAGENPYFAYLGLADHVIVTGDSVSMACEACGGSAPVSIFVAPGMVATKHSRLHAELVARGYARLLDGRPEAVAHPPLNAARVVAQRLREVMA
jgi:mitochondrial fission protein ELM1